MIKDMVLKNTDLPEVPHQQRCLAPNRIRLSTSHLKPYDPLTSSSGHNPLCEIPESLKSGKIYADFTGPECQSIARFHAPDHKILVNIIFY